MNTPTPHTHKPPQKPAETLAAHAHRGPHGAHALRALRAAGSLAAEILWPTRCAICDAPDSVLCDQCLAGLPYIDACRACPRCGAPYGSIQCSDCNPIMLEGLGLPELPYTAAASALLLDDRSHRVVSTYKDAGEQRLAASMALVMQRYIHPAWLREPLALTFVPSTKAAVRRRGFDHIELLAGELAKSTDLPCANLFERPSSHDQRKLSRKGRAANMHKALSIKEGAKVPPRVLVIDDVHTTGATLCAAATALREAHADEIYCLTFARA